MNLRQFGKIITLGVVNTFAGLLGKSLQPAILMYHSFDTTEWKHGVDPSELEKQIEYLLKHRTIVPLTHVVEWVKGERDIPNNAVAITVDDGYEDTYTVLYKLAKEKGFPFTLFLTTDLSPMPKLGNLPRVTWEQVEEMHASGLVAVEVHGHSHLNFTDALKQDRLDLEIQTSRKLIEDHTGYQPKFLAYPAGRHDVNVVRRIKESGFVAACATTQGVLQQGDNPFWLKRIVVDRKTNFSLFSGRLKPGFLLFLTLRRLF